MVSINTLKFYRLSKEPHQIRLARINYVKRLLHLLQMRAPIADKPGPICCLAMMFVLLILVRPQLEVDFKQPPFDNYVNNKRTCDELYDEVATIV